MYIKILVTYRMIRRLPAVVTIPVIDLKNIAAGKRFASSFVGCKLGDINTAIIALNLFAKNINTLISPIHGYFCKTGA